MATQNGLYHYKKDTDDFVVYADPASEIGSANITGITEDVNQNLWLGSHSAIIKLDLRKNETAVYGRKYEVIPNSLYDLIPFKTSKGELLFGDGTGYYKFIPQDLNVNTSPPQLQVTDFKIGDISLQPGHAPLLTSLDKINKLTLTYKQNNFSIDFAGMHYSSMDENRHIFMLKGYDKKWRKAGAEKTGAYFNVPPGNYLFRIKAAGSDGVWAEKNLTIIITPPWWFRWWAYALYAVITALAIWGIVYYRSLKLIKEKQQLWNQVKIRTDQVVKQKDEISIQRDNLKNALSELKSAQAQLVQREKMASLGELTAGVAHEIQNPLNFVNNFSEVNRELISELVDEVDKGNTEEVKAIANDIKENVQKIGYHGKRAEAIIKGMLHHSRFNTGQYEMTDINALANEYLRLSYHGLRAKDKTFTAELITDFDKTIGKINIVPQDIGRVFLNVFNNAIYAVREKQKTAGEGFTPTVSVHTKSLISTISIIVTDNGNGIPQSIIDKIFQPFFTTKPTGEGTGLGLSLSYDIIKGHGGEIKVNTREGEGSEFIIYLPPAK